MFHHKSFCARSFSARSWRFSQVLDVDFPPVFRRSGPLRIAPAKRRKLHAAAALAFGFSVSARGGMTIGAAAAGRSSLSVRSDAVVSLSGAGSAEVDFSIHSTADAVDVILEALMMAS